MRNFDLIYDASNKSYEGLQGILGDLFTLIQEDPTNENYKMLFEKVGYVAQSTVDTQLELAEAYAPDEDKEVLIGKLEDRANSLDNSLRETTATFTQTR